MNREIILTANHASYTEIINAKTPRRKAGKFESRFAPALRGKRQVNRLLSRATVHH